MLLKRLELTFFALIAILLFSTGCGRKSAIPTTTQITHAYLPRPLNNGFAYTKRNASLPQNFPIIRMSSGAWTNHYITVGLTNHKIGISILQKTNQTWQPTARVQSRVAETNVSKLLIESPLGFNNHVQLRILGMCSITGTANESITAWATPNALIVTITTFLATTPRVPVLHDYSEPWGRTLTKQSGHGFAEIMIAAPNPIISKLLKNIAWNQLI